MIPQVDGLVYVSEWGREALLDWLPEAARCPFAVIGSLVTPLRDKPVKEPIGDLVTIGNLDLVKNHRFLLKVLAEAKRSGRCFTLDVFGEGPLPERSLAVDPLSGPEGPGALPRLPARRARIPARLPGLRPRFLFRIAALAIIEAMAAGLPIVVGDIGPIPELCDDGVEARFWPLDDPAKAAATLIGLLNCEPARLKAAQRAGALPP